MEETCVYVQKPTPFNMHGHLETTYQHFMSKLESNDDYIYKLFSNGEYLNWNFLFRHAYVVRIQNDI